MPDLNPAYPGASAWAKPRPPASPTPTPNRPPLWQVMNDSLKDVNALTPAVIAGNFIGACYAAEIHALADWLVPLEQPPHRGMRPGGSNKTYQETLSVERQRLRAILLAEADRAEAGE